MEEKLIEAVQKFPCLFDKSKQEYKNKLKKEKAWESVATTTGATVEQCQKRWRTLRDAYVKHTVSLKQRSRAAADDNIKWRFMDAMTFLQRHVAPRRTISNMEFTVSEVRLSTGTEEIVIDEEASSSWSCDLSGVASTSEENSSAEERKRSGRSTKRQKLHEEAHEKFNDLCGAVSDLIASRKESCQKSRNAEFLAVLDSYLLKHPEEVQDRLKMQILNLVYQPNSM